ncbi:AraC family transcriptional regulator ligand-binding domain-containing protein [Pseudomonas peradeniyensis]|uniref:AraC family transcriptional regulator ligand-binding domain-containing protein n=1 Tax=Pseudomonas TaxID=286 RepID=UPI0021D4A02B|nr:AraC family transcriptional regulator ligand-binding domain-containing protein [Pseudomonas peradeniyensis]MCU7282057.1 AraC family transcriptional regulator ligand-binding domain-containing protein [Pseudomonas peradeniyensis]
MRETDRITREPANPSPERFHRGPLGRVLERYLQTHSLKARSNYSMLALEQLWAKAASHDPAIGLHLFSHFSRQDWHVLAQGCLYSATLAEAIRFWARYARLASDMDTLALIEEGDCLGVELRIDAPASLVRYMVEHYSVMSLSVMGVGMGAAVVPQRACFAHPRPAYYPEYREWFGDDIQFGCGYNRLYFNRGQLDMPLLTQHAGMMEVVSQELERRLAQQSQLSGWSARVAQGIRQGLITGRSLTLEGQAQDLHQSARTLRRRLEDEGTSFRVLLDRVRAELEQYLEMQGDSRAQIAAQLGYSDLAAYVHARKRWRSL